MEEEARDQQTAVLDELGIGREETRLARPPTDFEMRGAEVDASDHRGVAGRVVEFDGNLGCVIGAGGGSLTIFDALRKHGGKPANYCEIGGNPSVKKACELTTRSAGRRCVVTVRNSGRAGQWRSPDLSVFGGRFEPGLGRSRPAPAAAGQVISQIAVAFNPSARKKRARCGSSGSTACVRPVGQPGGQRSVAGVGPHGDGQRPRVPPWSRREGHRGVAAVAHVAELTVTVGTLVRGLRVARSERFVEAVTACDVAGEPGSPRGQRVLGDQGQPF